MKRTLAISTFGALLFSMTPVQSGGLVCSVLDSVWRSGHSSAQSSIISSLDTMGATFGQNSVLTTQLVTSALRVLTKGESTASSQESIAEQQAMKSVANTYSQQIANERIAEAHNTYGAPGQAVGSCVSVQKLGVLKTALDATETRATEIIMSGGIDTRPGSAVAPDKVVARRVLAGVSNWKQITNIEALEQPNLAAHLKDAMMNNLIGVPLAKPSSLDRPEQSFQLMAARRAEAFRSPATLSIAAYRAAHEEVGHFEVDSIAGSVNASFMGSMDWLIGQYGGGDDYEEWSASIVTKSVVGLSKELAKLKAVSLTLSNESSEITDRMQAVLATLLAVELDG